MDLFDDYRYWFTIVSIFMLVNWFATDNYKWWLFLHGMLLGSILTVILVTAGAYWAGPGG